MTNSVDTILDIPNTTGSISDRATPKSNNRSSNPLRTVLLDVWDEQLNPRGWINLGVAENVGQTLAISHFNCLLTQAKRLVQSELHEHMMKTV